MLPHRIAHTPLAMSEITQLLQQTGDDDGSALGEVFELLHADLKRLAYNRIGFNPDQSLTATALVHELYLKLNGAEQLCLQNRKHFFACAAQAMRQILVDAARASSAEKRGGDLHFVTLDDAAMQDAGTDLLALNEALDDLGGVDPRLAELVQLRFFAGLSMEDVAQVTGRSVRSLQRDWATARAFLNARMSA